MKAIHDDVTFAPRFAGKGLATNKRSGAEAKQTRKLREILVARQSGRCLFCRRQMTVGGGFGFRLRNTDATVEHVIPRALGGALSLENCVASCEACNKYRNCLAQGHGNLRRHFVNFLRRVVGRLDVFASALEARRGETGTGSIGEADDIAAPSGEMSR